MKPKPAPWSALICMALCPSSALAIINLPMKVYRGRPRGNNEPHRPEHELDLGSDEASLRAAVAAFAKP